MLPRLRFVVGIRASNMSLCERSNFLFKRECVCRIFVVFLQDNKPFAMNKVSIQYFDAPCGRLILGSYDGCLCLCDWLGGRRRERIDARIRRLLRADFVVQPSAVTSRAAAQLDEYFNGKRAVFHLPLLMLGTEFQKRVWQCLCSIPYGTTLSYSAEAARMGRRSAVRAVANANGANPMSVIVPCHRVVGSNGALTGYGGGMEIKRFLLDLERSSATPLGL